MSRVRSPNYPMIGLGTAIEKTRMIHKGEGKNTVHREAIAKLIGYGGLNGGSTAMMSALNKYGLLESKGDGEARVSDLALRILFPESAEEKQAALEEAAYKPVVFADIREKWPDRPPGEDSLRAFLTRKGFTESALEQVIQFYREIIDIATLKEPPQNASSASTSKETPMTPQEIISEKPTAPPQRDTSFVLSAGEPYRLSMTRGGIDVTARLTDESSTDELIQALQVWKILLKKMDDIHPPKED